MPDAAEPNNIIALFWDTYDLSLGGSVLYFHDTALNRFIVQYTQVCCQADAPKTFQAVLYADGRILLQYQDMQGDLTSATIGTEGPDGGEGLAVGCNEAFVQDQTALLIARQYNGQLISWQDADPDDNAAVSLYYDEQSAGFNGTLITDAIWEDPDGEADSYFWNTTTVTEGAYYIYAVIDDGANTPYALTILIRS